MKTWDMYNVTVKETDTTSGGNGSYQISNVAEINREVRGLQIIEEDVSIETYLHEMFLSKFKLNLKCIICKMLI